VIRQGRARARGKGKGVDANEAGGVSSARVEDVSAKVKGPKKGPIGGVTSGWGRRGRRE